MIEEDSGEDIPDDQKDDYYFKVEYTGISTTDPSQPQSIYEDVEESAEAYFGVDLKAIDYEIKAGKDIFDENGDYIGSNKDTTDMPHKGGGGLEDADYGFDGGGAEEWSDGNNYEEVVD